MTRTLKRKPRQPPAKKKPAAAVAPIEITNAQLAAELRGVAKRLGISFAALSGVIAANLQGHGVASPDDDGSVSLAEFDRSRKARREARLRRREEAEAAWRVVHGGTEAEKVAARGATLNAATGETYIDHQGNPDELVEAAASLLKRRSPHNWHAVVVEAWLKLRQAVALELTRPLASQADCQRARAALKVFRPADEPEGIEAD